MFEQNNQINEKTRVELSCHTNYNCFGGRVSVEEYVDVARKMEMSALGIMDRDTLDAFPEMQSSKIANTEPKFKFLYGVEMVARTGVDKYAVINYLIKNEKGKKEFYAHYSRMQEQNKEVDWGIAIIPYDQAMLVNLREDFIGVPLKGGEIIPSENSEDDEDIRYHFDFLVGIYADKMDGFEEYPYYDYVMITPEMDEKLVIDAINKCKETGKIPVAVSAPYYLDMDERLSYDIEIIEQKQKDVKPLLARENAKEYFMSTEEMLKVFSYLGEELAEEIVVTNSNLIADMCEIINPIETGMIKPVVPDGMTRIRELCNTVLFSKYKDVYANLVTTGRSKYTVDEITSRLNWELDAIERNHNEFLFLSLYEVISKNNILSFTIGTRGAVNASIVAYLLGITSIDPLEFDLPPYFFFGLDGNKELDIDINLGSFYEKNRFIDELEKLSYIEETIQVSVNTIGQDTDKTKKHMLKSYHPSGIYLIPKGVNAKYEFPLYNTGSCIMPDMVGGFDYYKSKDRFYKLDLLVNDELNSLKTLYTRTNANPELASHSDKRILDMFHEDSFGMFECEGLPEFCSEFVLDSLALANPQNYDELCKLLGFMHGTGLWIDNAMELLLDGDVSIAEIPAFREEIYLDLVKVGIAKETAYDIAELVRKGKVYRTLNVSAEKRSQAQNVVLFKWNQYREEMREAGIADWYISYLEKVQYMFPKAHALGYLEKTWQLAWFKCKHSREYFKYGLIKKEQANRFHYLFNNSKK